MSQSIFVFLIFAIALLLISWFKLVTYLDR